MDDSNSKTRTNIEIDDRLIDIVMRRYGVRTKTEAVHLALRHSAGQPLSTNEMLSMQGAQFIGEISADTGLQHFDSVG